MTDKYYRPAESGISGQYASGLRKRLSLLILFSTVTVALAFGLSFYFGLVSGGSAITKQFPELEAIAVKMQSLLLMNTMGFVAIIIASFYLLTKLVTRRIFATLAAIEKKMNDFTDTGRLPGPGTDTAGPFESIGDAFDSAVSRLNSDVEKDLELLREVVASLGQGDEELRERVESLVVYKERTIGVTAGGSDTGKKVSEDDGRVFMQPV